MAMFFDGCEFWNMPRLAERNARITRCLHARERSSERICQASWYRRHAHERVNSLPW